MVKSKQFRSYVRADVAIVHKTKEAFGGLSNMASGYPLKVSGIKILTSEALYQSCRFPHLPEVQKEILGQHSPMTAKMVGKPHLINTRADWDKIRHNVMRWCLRVKLAQNYEKFGQLLLSTDDTPIVEQSKKDDYWGAIQSVDWPNQLVGQNVLGRLLMELREELIADSKEALKTVLPLGVPDFLLLGKKIDVVTAEDVEVETKQNELF